MKNDDESKLTVEYSVHSYEASKINCRRVVLSTWEMEAVLLGTYPANTFFENSKGLYALEDYAFAWRNGGLQPVWGVIRVNKIAKHLANVVIVTDAPEDMSKFAEDKGFRYSAGMIIEGDSITMGGSYEVHHWPLTPKGVTTNKKTAKSVAKWKNDKQPYHKR